MRNMEYKYKIIGGLLKECSSSPGFKSVIQDIDQSFYKIFSDTTQQTRFLNALKLNLINRKKYPINSLLRWNELAISEKTFTRYKQLYAAEFLKHLCIYDGVNVPMGASAAFPNYKAECGSSPGLVASGSPGSLAHTPGL